MVVISNIKKYFSFDKILETYNIKNLTSLLLFILILFSKPVIL